MSLNTSQKDPTFADRDQKNERSDRVEDIQPFPSFRPLTTHIEKFISQLSDLEVGLAAHGSISSCLLCVLIIY